MTDRTTVHGLQVATDAAPLHRTTGAARHRRRRRRRSGKGFDAIVRDLAPKNAALLAERDRLQAELDAWHRAHPGPIARHAGLPRLPREDRLPGAAAQAREGHHRQRRRRARAAGRPAAGGADPQCALCAERRQRALGLAVRRALRHRRDPRRPAAPRSGPGYNAVRGAKVIEYARHVLDRPRRWSNGSHTDATGYRVDGRPARGGAEGRQHHARWRTPAQFVGYQGDAAAPSVGAAACTTACTSTSASTARTPIGKTDAGRRQRRGARSRRCPPSSTSKTRWRWSTPTTRCWPTRNWLGILQGTLTEDVTKGGKTFTRGLNPDREYTGADGERGARCTAAR